MFTSSMVQTVYHAIGHAKLMTTFSLPYQFYSIARQPNRAMLHAAFVDNSIYHLVACSAAKKI
jgi:hypothetical protein